MSVTLTKTSTDTDKFKEELGSHLRVLKSFYYGNAPIPSNSKAILKFLLKLLEHSRTNSFYFADPATKTIALAYVLILISHTADYPAITGFTINDPQSLEFLEPDDSTIKQLIKFVKKTLRDMEA